MLSIDTIMLLCGNLIVFENILIEISISIKKIYINMDFVLNPISQMGLPKDKMDEKLKRPASPSQKRVVVYFCIQFTL